MARILLTGTAGFIGSHVAEALLKRGDSVIGIDNLNDYYPVIYKKRNLESLEAYRGFSFIRGDFVDGEFVRSVFSQNKITHVAHIAARAGVRPSIKDPFVYEETNVRGTLNLLDQARQHDVENFLFTSSSSVYGNSHDVPFRENDSATDLPISPYSATKKAGEVLAHSYHYLYGMNVNIVRPFTVYGPRGRPDMAPWLFVKWALSGEPIKKFGDGTTRRDYTFIDDIVPGFVNAIDRAFGYEIFNLGNSDTVSLNEVLQTISEITQRELNIETLPMQPGDVEITFADISKAREKLSYRPSTKFPKGMEKFYEWYREKVL